MLFNKDNTIKIKPKQRHSRLLLLITFLLCFFTLHSYVQSFQDDLLKYIKPEQLEYLFECNIKGDQSDQIYSDNNIFLKEISQENTKTTAWKRFSEFSNDRLRFNTNIWFKIPIDSINSKNQALYFITYLSDFQVYYNNKVIYKNNPNQTGEYYYNRHVIVIPDSESCSNVFIKVRYESPTHYGRIFSIYSGDKDRIAQRASADYRQMIKQNLLNLILGSFLVLLGFISLIIFVYRIKEKHFSILFFSLISFTAGINYVLHYIILIPINISPFFYNVSIFLTRDLIYLLILSSPLLINKKLRFKMNYIIMLILSLLLLFDMYLIMFYPVESFVKWNLVAITSVSIFGSAYLFIKYNMIHKTHLVLPLVSISIFFIISLNDVLVHLHLLPWTRMFYEYGIIFLVFGIGYIMIRHYLSMYKAMYQMSSDLHLKEKELLSAQKERLVAEFESLKSQVNPHFLFNTFNTLISVIEENKDNAIEFVQQLSKVYRYVLQTKGKDLVSLDEEMSFIEAYGYLLNQRHGDNLIINNNISHIYKEYYLPPLTLQLLVENAVKHNIITSKKVLYIDIYTSEDGYLVVRNLLQKKSTVVESTGIGLHNIKERYRHLQDKAVFVEENMYYFTVKLPLLEKR